MSVAKPNRIGTVALAVALGGIVIAVLISVIGSLLGEDLVMLGYLVFAAAQVAALVLGIMGWASAFGRSAAIMAPLLLAGSVLFL